MSFIGRMGWRKQPPDFRDFQFAPKGFTLKRLPSVVDLSWGYPPIFDQGNLGSCTANAISGALGVLQARTAIPFTASRLFIYYNERVLIDEVEFDSGAYIRDGFKSISKLGCAAEGRDSSGSWEYDISRFAEKPSLAAYNHALNHKAISYYAVPQTLVGIRSALSEGLPVVFGFNVYDSLYNVGEDGIVPMPSAREEYLGGHAVTIVGYDDGVQRYKIANSWGTGWGDKGFMYMPYAYVHDPGLSDDFWVVREIEPGLG